MNQKECNGIKFNRELGIFNYHYGHPVIAHCRSNLRDLKEMLSITLPLDHYYRANNTAQMVQRQEYRAREWPALSVEHIRKAGIDHGPQGGKP